MAAAGVASDGDGMKNDRPKENEKGKYKSFSQFPLQKLYSEKKLFGLASLYVYMLYARLLGLPSSTLSVIAS